MTKKTPDSDIEFSGKVYGQTFKQFQLEKLKKDGQVFPASMLEERKREEEEQALEFARSVEDEENLRRVRPSRPVAPVGKSLSDSRDVYTRVPIEED
jgi:hypothetical protein